MTAELAFNIGFMAALVLLMAVSGIIGFQTLRDTGRPKQAVVVGALLPVMLLGGAAVIHWLGAV